MVLEKSCKFETFTTIHINHYRGRGKNKNLPFPEATPGDENPHAFGIKTKGPSVSSTFMDRVVTYLSLVQHHLTLSPTKTDITDGDQAYPLPRDAKNE